MEIIMNRKLYFGIDIGGTFIKGAIVDEKGNIVLSDKVATQSEKGTDFAIENIASLCSSLLSAAKLSLSDICAMGMGVPGMIDSEKGVVVSSNNLNWFNFPIANKLEAKLGITVKIANDANAAALGELLFSFGGTYKNVIMLTLGTGVGGGIIIDGKIYEGNCGAGAELGHTVIAMNGEPCTCGRRGCLEAYASATAIIRETRRAMDKHPDSKLWEVGSKDEINGKTAFDFYGCDIYAKEVVDNYIYALGCGIINMANIFRPEAVILGGGVCAQGDALIKPLQKIVDEEIFGKSVGPRVKIITAKLGNSAGCLGAAALVI
jgi:glucokinase